MGTLIKILVALVAVGAAAAVAAWFLPSRLERLVHGSVESYVTETAGTPADLGTTAIDLRRSRATLTGLTIGNPEGFASGPAMEIGEIHVDLAASSLLEDVLHIEAIALREVAVNVDHRGETSNITEILDHMGSGAEPSEPAGAEERVRIDRFVLTDARIALNSDALSGPEELRLPPVELAAIGGANGATYEQAVEAVLSGILGAARTAVLERLRGAASEAVREEAEEAVREGLRDLLEE